MFAFAHQKASNCTHYLYIIEQIASIVTDQIATFAMKQQ